MLSASRPSYNERPIHLVPSRGKVTLTGFSQLTQLAKSISAFNNGSGIGARQNAHMVLKCLWIYQISAQLTVHRTGCQSARLRDL